jgi:hypothetical protein
VGEVDDSVEIRVGVAVLPSSVLVGVAVAVDVPAGVALGVVSGVSVAVDAGSDVLVGGGSVGSEGGSVGLDGGSVGSDGGSVGSGGGSVGSGGGSVGSDEGGVGDGTVCRSGLWPGAAHSSGVEAIAAARRINRPSDKVIFFTDVILSS